MILFNFSMEKEKSKNAFNGRKVIIIIWNSMKSVKIGVQSGQNMW